MQHLTFKKRETKKKTGYGNHLKTGTEMLFKKRDQKKIKPVKKIK